MVVLIPTGSAMVLGLARNPALERLAADWDRGGPNVSSRRRASRSGSSARSTYKAATWDRPRRRDRQGRSRTAQGPNPRFITVNVPGDPQELYEDVYRQRGEMENRIKEQQLTCSPIGPVLPPVPGQSVPSPSLSSAAYVLGPGTPTNRVAGDGPGEGPGGDDSAQALEGGGAEGRRDGSPHRVSPGHQLPIPGSFPERLSAA